MRLTFYDSKADVLLLELTATIPDKFKPYLLGFDASEDAVPRRAIGIHHPNGSVKRISYANDRHVPLFMAADSHSTVLSAQSKSSLLQYITGCPLHA